MKSMGGYIRRIKTSENETYKVKDGTDKQKDGTYRLESRTDTQKRKA